MAIGASFGRMVGIMVQSLHESFPESAMFKSCQPDVPCITPGTYAFLGAGAALSGIMHLTISVTVIMFELTGATTYILPTMIVVGVTKVVSELLSPGGGIADRMIAVNGLPFLDNKETQVFGAPVSHAMIRHLVVIPATSMRLRDLQGLLNNRNPITNERTQQYQGWPVVLDRKTKFLIGWIGRMELNYAVDKALSGSDHPVPVEMDTRCRFVSHRETIGKTILDDDGHAATVASDTIDLSAYVDRAPISVHPALPLETAVEMFKKLGPRVILVEYQGRLCGLLTIKDLLKYKFRTENEETQAGSGDGEEGLIEKYIWKLLQCLGELLRTVTVWRTPSWTGYEHLTMDSSATSPRASLYAGHGLMMYHGQGNDATPDRSTTSIAAEDTESGRDGQPLIAPRVPHEAEPSPEH
ncbi:glycerol ethanol, ferric requiring protein [Ascosphaera aggregata]|nr:glycerol ethanol, ferric requiring protein [Ascosphaera aggregata]